MSGPPRPGRNDSHRIQRDRLFPKFQSTICRPQFTIRGAFLSVLALTAAAPLPAQIVNAPRPPRPVLPKPAFVYVHENAVQHRVWGYKREKTGLLTPLKKFPKVIGAPAFTGGGPCGTAAYSKKRRMVFMTTATGVEVFRFAPASGALTPVKGGPHGGARVLGLATADIGAKAYLYGTDEANDRIYAWEILGSGKLKAVLGSPFAAGDHPVTLAAAGGRLFAANTEGLSISAYRIGAKGELLPAPGSPFAATGSTLPFGLLADPDGKHVYAANCMGAPEVYGYSVNATTAALTPHPNPALTTGLVDTCSGLALAGTNLLFSFQTDGSGVKDIQALRRSATGLSIAGLPQSSGIGVDLASGDPTGQFLLTARAQFGQSLRSFSVNATTGQLTLLDVETPAWGAVDGMVVIQ